MEEPGENMYFIKMQLAGTEGRDGQERECSPEDSARVEFHTYLLSAYYMLVLGTGPQRRQLRQRPCPGLG